MNTHFVPAARMLHVRREKADMKQKRQEAREAEAEAED
ncbi:hypothetical protein DDE82_008768 [Stemphylium lycopersici]|nr:hypothetical protein DDE82_008768 [Stemphylium lycopersici]